MRTMSKKSKVAAVAASVALVAVGGGAAYAYWSTTGSGTGSATTSAGTAPVVLHAAFAQGLAPGGQEDVTYTADNPNSSSTMVGSLATTVTTSDPGCLPEWFISTPPATNTAVAANATATALGTGTLSFTDNASVNQDPCKNATITLTVTSK
ncbi:hypothetical protein [Arthrobacter sp. 92]|uniref:hypothetical protein n=1 Tax=Arthrobacter sp. 92 TaxID=3418175 RepID=UPI003CFD7674